MGQRKRACELGLTRDELRVMLGEQLDEFTKWMHGQTMTVCPDHGVVVYADDLARFLRSDPVID